MESRPIQTLKLSTLREPAHRLRENISSEELGTLADDIAANGLHQPIGARGPFADGSYEIVWGHRRYLAHQLIRRDDIEARVFPADYDPLDAAAAENLNRVQLAPMDEARLVDRYATRGEPDSAIARVLRRSLSWVTQRKEMLTWPAEIQHGVNDGELTIAAGRSLAAIDHDEYRRALIDEAKRTGANARTIEVWRAHYAADRERIIGNRLAVEEIAASREAWRLMIHCELCGDLHEYQNTRAVRACEPCWAAIASLMEATTRAQAPAPGDPPPAT